MSEYTTFTSESVSEGHPDKLSDHDDLTAHLYLRLLNIQTDEEITLNVLERGKIRQKKFVKTISSPDTIKIKEKKEKDKFELFFKDNSKEILKVIQNVNGREFIWESL